MSTTPSQVHVSTIATSAAASVVVNFTGTTAGNTLVARVVSNATGSMATPAGWTKVAENTVTNGSVFATVAVFKLVNVSAGKSTETFSQTGATSMAAVVTELTPCDSSRTNGINAGGVTTGTTTLTVSASAADATNNAHVFVAEATNLSKTATFTKTDAWTPSGGTAGGFGASDGDNGTIKQIWHYTFQAYRITGNNGGSAPDSVTTTYTLSQGALTNGAACLVSFEVPPVPTPKNPTMVGQAVNRSVIF